MNWILIRCNEVECAARRLAEANNEELPLSPFPYKEMTTESFEEEGLLAAPWLWTTNNVLAVWSGTVRATDEELPIQAAVDDLWAAVHTLTAAVHLTKALVGFPEEVSEGLMQWGSIMESLNELTGRCISSAEAHTVEVAAVPQGRKGALDLPDPKRTVTMKEIVDLLRRSGLRVFPDGPPR